MVPSGKLPLEVPRHYDAPPSGYLAPPLGSQNDVSTADPTPMYPFGHGLSYTTFGYSDLSVRAEPGDRRLRLRWRWTRSPAFL